MTIELQRPDWNTFFNRLSRDFAGWQTTVRVLDDDHGAQVLSRGLPFTGLTLDTKGHNGAIELRVGGDTDRHLTHNILDPETVAFEAGGAGLGGTLHIGERSGKKVLISFFQPSPLLMCFAPPRAMAAAFPGG